MAAASETSLRASQHRSRTPTRSILKNKDSIKYHSTYYFDDGNVFILVGDCIYKIHRYFLIRESVVFKRNFEQKPSWHMDNAESPGKSDKNPLILSDITPYEFDQLLDFIYFGMHKSYNPSTFDWTTLLKVAWRLEFEGIKHHAISELAARKDDPSDGLPPSQQIFIALHCDIPSWLEPAYTKIVYDPTPLSFDVAVKLPPEIAVMLCRARELYHHRDNWTWVSKGHTHARAGRREYRHSWSAGMTVTANVQWVSAHKRSAEEIVKEQLALLDRHQQPTLPKIKRQRRASHTLDDAESSVGTSSQSASEGALPSKHASRNTI